MWKTRSLRFWLTVGLCLAILPLATAAASSYVLLNHGVIGSLNDVSMRLRHQMTPVHRLRALLFEALIPVDEFVDDGDPAQPPAYRLLRQRIESEFAALHSRLANDPEPRTLVERAREDWTAADRIAGDILAVHRPGGDLGGVELMQRFHASIQSATDKLGAAATDLERELENDHDRALRFYERTEWISGIGGFVSLAAILIAVAGIGRVVSASVDRLVDGAERFAAGDRDHRIDVQVPPELHSVAQEFNRMIERIHESEEALAELARLDGLTKLPNRRAFDEALGEMFAAMRRLGTSSSLLILDVDHFKKVNDTYGHGVGDDVLRTVARALGEGVRANEPIFRIGGEEFAVLLPGADSTAARATGERLRQSVALRPIAAADASITVTVSVGLAVAYGDCEPAALVQTADEALYRAKREGRNRTVG